MDENNNWSDMQPVQWAPQNMFIVVKFKIGLRKPKSTIMTKEMVLF